MATRFEIVLTDGGSYLFQLRDGTGEVLLKGPEKASKIMVQNGILHLRSALRDPSRLEPHTNVDGSSFLLVRDSDGSALARSRKTADDAGRANLEQALAAAAGAPMIDLTKHGSSGHGAAGHRTAG